MIHYVLDIIVVLLLVGVAVSAWLCPSEAAVPYQGAALIAAAPELYRELEELASLVQNSDSTYWEGVNPDEVVETALAALAKAKGE